MGLRGVDGVCEVGWMGQMGIVEGEGGEAYTSGISAITLVTVDSFADYTAVDVSVVRVNGISHFVLLGGGWRGRTRWNRRRCCLGLVERMKKISICWWRG